MRVCYFGGYGREHPRNAVNIKGLRKAGVEVVECHTLHPVKALRYPLLMQRYLGVANDIDVLMVGGQGHAYVPLARLLATATGKPLVFDAFISKYDTLVCDREIVARSSLKAKGLHWLDSVACTLSDIVFLDTAAHVDYFCEEFGLDRSRFRVVPLGADEDLFYPRPHISTRGIFTAVFVGTFIPLQGIKYIVQAASFLQQQDRTVRFLLVGNGQTYKEAVALADSLGVDNVEFRGYVQSSKVPELVAEADICLGIFGDTDKAQRVIPHKVCEGLAMKKAVITADTPAIRCLLAHGESAFLCPPADPEGLAEAIRCLRDNGELRQHIATKGFEMFKRKASAEVIGTRLREICEELLQ